MSVYLILARGPDADAATPVLASSDPRVINAALQAIAHLDEPEHEVDSLVVDCHTTLADEEGEDEPRP